MLERVGLRVKLEVLSWRGLMRKFYLPVLDKPPEEQDWDLMVFSQHDYYGNTGTTFLTWPFIEESNIRWIEYDPVYEEMWKDMAMTVDPDVQEERIQRLEKYVYDHAYALFIYSPLMLYAVNKEVNLIPQKFQLLRLKETSVTDNHWSVEKIGRPQ
jgi:ABC-type transport system substrate-binding protein